MTTGELFYLILALATFGGFGLWLAYNSVRFDRSRGGRPEARRLEAQQAQRLEAAPHDMAHASAD